MAELSFEIPVLNEDFSTAAPKVDTALENIKAWANGEESVAEKQLTAALKAKINAKVAGLTVVFYSGSATLKSGELAIQEKSNETFTLPSATAANQNIGVFAGASSTNVKIAASGGQVIVGDFFSGSTATLTNNQHVSLQSTGVGWIIVAGEPKRTGEYSAVRTARSAGVEYEASANRPALVTIVPTGTISLFVTGAELLAGESVSSYTFELGPGQKWVYTSSGATVRSSYYLR